MVNTKQKRFKLAKNILYIGLSIVMSPAFAQANNAGLCYLVTFIKAIIGTVAVLAVLTLVINSFFGKSALIGEIVEKVLIGCVVAVGATFLIQSTGLPAGSCN